MRILIAGASGLIGSELERQLGRTEHEVGVLVRGTTSSSGQRLRSWTWHPDQPTSPQPELAEALEWADAVLSLNGASIGKLPWTKQWRHIILSSRVDSTGTLARAIAASSQPPATWVSASAVGYYGNRPGESLTEQSTPGSGFLATVVQQWEAAADPARSQTRVVHARTGFVLAKDGSLGPIAALTKFGLGGRLGHGTQHWPWISLHDEASAWIHLATSSELAGPVNLAAPAPATSADITRAVAHALHRPHIVPAPEWALRLALHDAADELLLADQLVVPERLQSDGFAFADQDLRPAVAAALAS